MSNIKHIDICEVKKDVSDNLLEAVDIVDKAEEKRQRNLYDDLVANYDSIEAVLFTLNRCVDTSSLGFWFGNKRKMNVRYLIKSANKYNRLKGLDLPELHNEHVKHKNFLHIINSITVNIFGEDYVYNFHWDDYEEYLLWKDDTIGEYLKYQGYPNLKSFALPAIIFFFITIPLCLTVLICLVFEKKISLKTRNLI
ncbi:TPA: hypothetical protein NNW70_004192 [Salmonella enterica]|nr:hypothetical protein [Salmonella enterica]HCH9607902.1 hypothetical protein [Salmonella enterica]HDI5000196.1 hypothetical protein [Salmonella enterica]